MITFKPTEEFTQLHLLHERTGLQIKALRQQTPRDVGKINELVELQRITGKKIKNLIPRPEWDGCIRDTDVVTGSHVVSINVEDDSVLTTYQRHEDGCTYEFSTLTANTDKLK